MLLSSEILKGWSVALLVHWEEQQHPPWLSTTSNTQNKQQMVMRATLPWLISIALKWACSVSYNEVILFCRLSAQWKVASCETQRKQRSWKDAVGDCICMDERLFLVKQTFCFFSLLQLIGSKQPNNSLMLHFSVSLPNAIFFTHCTSTHRWRNWPEFGDKQDSKVVYWKSCSPDTAYWVCDHIT